MSAGKGDSYRPVNQKVYDENYDFIFRRKPNEPAPDQAPVSEQAPQASCRVCGNTCCIHGRCLSDDCTACQAGDDEAGQ